MPEPQDPRANQIRFVKLLQERFRCHLQTWDGQEGERQELVANLQEESKRQVLLLQVSERIRRELQLCKERLRLAGESSRAGLHIRDRISLLQQRLEEVVHHSVLQRSLPAERKGVSCSSPLPDPRKGVPWQSHLTAERVARVAKPVTRRPKARLPPLEVFPASPSAWKSAPTQSVPCPRIVQAPVQGRDQSLSARNARDRRCVQNLQTSSPLISSVPASSRSLSRILDPQSHPHQWQRIKELAERLRMSENNQDRIDSAKALGLLGYRNPCVIDSLSNVLQGECPALQYEAVKALTLLGHLECPVVVLLVQYINKANTEIKMDILQTLETTLQKDDLVHMDQDKSLLLLVSCLEGLLASGEQHDKVSLQAATCLTYLDNTNDHGCHHLLSFLGHSDMKSRMKALKVLLSQVKLHNEWITRGLMDQLLHSSDYQHRIQACTWLQCVGLQRIREQGLEQDLYTLLGEKIYSDPLLFVRKNIAMTMEVLEMKNAMWETSERQLEDPSAERRIQAVLSLAALGLRYNRTQRHLLEMLDVDQSESVRVQIIRLFCSLGLKDPSIQRNLKMKEQGVGVLAREASKALRILQKTHRDFPNQCHNPSNG